MDVNEELKFLWEGGGQGRCEQRSEVFVKVKKEKKKVGCGGGGSSRGGVFGGGGGHRWM